MSIGENNVNPIQQGKDVVQDLLARWFGKWGGRRFFVIMVAVLISIAVIIDISEYTMKAWRYLSGFSTKHTSMLTTDELEVANEWVIRVNSGATFSQVNAYKDRLFRVALLEGEPWRHFTLNLRIVRDPKTKGGSSSNRVGNLP